MIVEATEALTKELANFEGSIAGDYLAGPLSAADYTLYPYMAISLRIERRYPAQRISDLIGPKLRAWMGRIEALPYFEKTFPPGWK